MQFGLMRILQSFVAAAWLAVLYTDAQGQDYVSVEFGGHHAPALTFINTSSYYAIVCHEFYEPIRPDPGCLDPKRTVDFNHARGLTGSLALGIRFTSLLIAELEYLGHHSGFSQNIDAAPGAGIVKYVWDPGIFLARETLGDITSHSLMLNLYVALAPPRRGPWIPYVGAGAGLSRVSMHYAWSWFRNPFPGGIVDRRGSSEDDWIRNWLGINMSLGNAELQDYVFAWQALIGLDYMMTRRVSLGAKLRFVDFVKFGSDALGLDPLGTLPRNEHLVHLTKDRRVNVFVGTSELQTVSLALVMRYHFWL